MQGWNPRKQAEKSVRVSHGHHSLATSFSLHVEAWRVIINGEFLCWEIPDTVDHGIPNCKLRDSMTECSWLGKQDVWTKFTVKWTKLLILSSFLPQLGYQARWSYNLPSRPGLSSSAASFSFCLHYFPVLRSFPMNWLFASGGRGWGGKWTWIWANSGR